MFELDDVDSIAHIVLGYSAWVALLYIVVYVKLIRRESLDWLSRFWFAYLLVQCMKCPFTVETNQVYGPDGPDGDWPAHSQFINLILAILVTCFQLLVWITLLIKSGSNYNQPSNAKYFRVCVYVVFGVEAVVLLIVIAAYAVTGSMGFGKAVRTLHAGIAGILNLIAWIYVVVCVTKGRLVASKSKGKSTVDAATTKRLVWFTLLFTFIGIVSGILSAKEGVMKIGKAPYGLFGVLGQTYALLYLEQFENYKNLFTRSATNQQSDDEQALNSDAQELI
eukprot:CAMPEP_0197030612 /NCGR_PEP_ID=MMETSP1384-20130603/9808_1 /TAXON_ID=29189 /ORGANISM="Ammonia sp." /LENGTH=278 /DNA_ID=CAMNT_0042459997 /DNA_START=885 /DNA_END=1721 /DNA_ORIENTATION=-